MNELELSKILSHALRHCPSLYNIDLDDEGWVSISELTEGLNKKGVTVNEDLILNLVQNSRKKRHEVKGEKIRASYGHTLEKKIYKDISHPPKILYHGTSDRNLLSIKEKGVLSMDRQYVHLSINYEVAKKVGIRKEGRIVVLEIEAEKAFLEGNIGFYKEINDIWLSDNIPQNYIKWS